MFISANPARKNPLAMQADFFNEARLAAHEAMLRIMKNDFLSARFASCPKDASYCASNASLQKACRIFLRHAFSHVNCSTVRISPVSTSSKM